jgi:carboxylesterase type B
LQDTRDPLELVVATENGQVRGSRVEGVDKFLAIPYAAPPTGALRWKPPAAASNWSGVRDATRFGSACAQPEGGNGPQVLDEDCLFVNVFRPAGTTEQSKLPVYFFIHGGGNTTGSSIQHDATKFAQDNRLIIVTLNYRLGVFGFLGLPSLRAESTDNASGNYALMDQQAAMRWTQRNIAKFGGDPQRVTMAGESAGASAVCMHLTSPTAHGLFMRGVMESGNCFATPLDTLETSGTKYAAAAGCADAATAAQCLRSKSPLDLIQTAASTAVITQPVMAGNLLPQAPFEAIRAGTWNKVPMIIGANHDEQRIFLFLGIGGKLPVSDTGYTEQVHRLFGASAERVLAEYPLKAYPNASIALSAILDGYVGRSCRSVAMVDVFSKTASVWHFEFNDPTAPHNSLIRITSRLRQRTPTNCNISLPSTPPLRSWDRRSRSPNRCRRTGRLSQQQGTRAPPVGRHGHIGWRRNTKPCRCRPGQHNPHRRRGRSQVRLLDQLGIWFALRLTGTRRATHAYAAQPDTINRSKSARDR